MRYYCNICSRDIINKSKYDKIDYNTKLNGIYVPDSDLKESFKEIEICKIHSNYNYDNDNNDDN